VHRFDHALRFVHGHTRWDWPCLRDGVREGLAQAAEGLNNEPIASVSCDAWAQDFGLLDTEGNLIYSPVSYRDARSESFPEGYVDRVSPEELVARVGGGALPIITLCQLYVMAREEPEVLSGASTLLHMADLVHYDLCGVAATDWTLATASQLRNLKTGDWDRALLDLMGIPHHLLPPLVRDPQVLGPIPRERAPHPKLIGVPVVVAANHDTSAASVAAGPFGEGTLLLTAGTYAMLGCVSDEPLLPPDAAGRGCALLGLAAHRWGLFMSVMGQWIIQECHRLWAREGHPVSYEDLVRQAETADIRGTIVLSDPRFRAPEDIRDELCRACLEAGVSPPRTQGEFARVVFDSMIGECREAAAVLADLTGRHFRCVHVVSGGSRNRYLCQGVTDALGLPVLAGPAEATAIGNILLQASVLNAIPSHAVAQIVDASFPRTHYTPRTS
jgi:rhamnulokinase